MSRGDGIAVSGYCDSFDRWMLEVHNRLIVMNDVGFVRGVLVFEVVGEQRRMTREHEMKKKIG